MNKTLSTTAVFTACLAASLLACAETPAKSDAPAAPAPARPAHGVTLVIDGTVASVSEKSFVVRYPHMYDKTKEAQITFEVNADTKMNFGFEVPTKSERVRNFKVSGPAKWENVKEGVRVMVPLPEWAFPVTDAELKSRPPAYALNGKPVLATKIDIVQAATTSQPASPSTSK